jgi:hypothetical protein
MALRNGNHLVIPVFVNFYSFDVTELAKYLPFSI